jgi:hypothetical protein
MRPSKDMRLEIIIPDSTPPERKAKLANLTRRLSAQPELVDGIDLMESTTDAEIQRRFTPEFVTSIAEIDLEMERGIHFTKGDLDDRFRQKTSEWTRQNPS